MPESDAMPGRRAATSDLVGDAPAFRLGIAPRLGFAFLAVTVLAIVANLIAEHGTTIIETRRLGTEATRLYFPTPAAREIPDRLLFIAAVAEADRAVRERVAANSPDSTVAVDRALRALAEATATYPLATVRANGAERRGLSRLAGAYRGEGAAAIRLADSRRGLIEAYLRRLAALDSALKSAVDRSWKIFGRVVAREFLIDLNRCLDTIRGNSGALTAAVAGDAQAPAALVESEGEFDALLRTNSQSLRRSQGAAWQTQVRADFDELVTQRAAVMDATDQFKAALARLTRARGDLLSFAQLHTASVAPVPLASTATGSAPVSVPMAEPASTRQDAPSVATLAGASAREWVAWITALVLTAMFITTVSTILSIVRPVRRLVEAARRLSAGDDVRVVRGGIRELDVLAVAFNDMARQLAAAQVAAHAHQEELEATVQQRTGALQHLAEHDSLTQLPNRRLLIARLTQALTEATKAGRRVGVYFLDIDNFKNLNDSMGHGFGDRVLQGVSERLRESATSFGFAARLGGDEFTLVYLAAPSTAAIAEAGAAVCRAFHDPLLVGERQVKISVSVGISVYPDHEHTADALLRAADAALFRAKELGRSQLRMFTPDLLEAAVSKFSIEQGLRRAVDLGEFELLFQPEVSLQSRTPTLVEALLRWRTPDGRLLAPGEFLGVAEESGLILDISDWVLRTAVQAAAVWHHGAWPEVRVAINVSSRQMLDTQFVDRVCELLREHRLPPGCIELELTENVLQTGSTTIDALRQLRSHGVAIALDDFGTGYSSLSSLELLPLSRVKLDRSLIASIDSSAVSRAIAGAIIALCSNLDLDVTAEGVERPEQLAMLVGNRRIHVQGFLFSPPTSADQLLAELESLPGRVRSLLASCLQAEARGSEPEVLSFDRARTTRGGAS